MLRGTAALDAIRLDFADVDLHPPAIPEHFVVDLRYDPTGSEQLCPIEAGSPPVFSPLAPYGLEFNELPEDYFPRSDDGNFLSLAGWVEMYPSTDGFLVYGSRSNEAGTGHGWMARSGGLFAVQQAWQPHGEEDPFFTPFNQYSKAFDYLLTPYLSRVGEPVTTLVVFSDYRRVAIIASSIAESWHPELRDNRVTYGPLPDGWGLVFDLGSYDEDDVETPRRDLESLVWATHAPVVTAAAKYLNECLWRQVLRTW